jgi:hypothetical protein
MRGIVRLVGLTAALALVGPLIAAPVASGSGRDVPQMRRSVTTAVHGRLPASNADDGVATSLGIVNTGRRPMSTASVSEAPASSAPSSAFGFDALGDVDGSLPSDTTGALGDDWFLTAVNSSYALWKLDGTVEIPATSLGDLAPNAHLDVFDPKVVYDQYHDTFVLVFLGQSDAPKRSSITIVAIPNATANQPTTWCVSTLEGDMVGSTPAVWADFPGVGYTADRVTITTNQFAFPSSADSFQYAQVLSMPGSALYDCTQTLVADVFSGTKTSEPDGSPASTIQPAQTVGAATTDQYMLSFRRKGRDSFVTVWRIRPAADGSLSFRKTALVVGKTRTPPPGTQGGGSLTSEETWWDTGDTRLINAFYDADRGALYGAHSVSKSLTPDTVTGDYIESAIRWYEVDLAGRLGQSSLGRKGTIGAPETDAGWPSIASDASGNVYLTYSRASQPAGEFLSAWVAQIPPGSTTATPFLLAPGTATYDAISGLERWGDYTAIGRDPVDGAYVATFNQYAASSTSFQQRVDVITDA